jgi:hypothetical protein
MYMKSKYILIGALLLLFALLLVACSSPQPAPNEQETQAPAVTQEPCPTAAPCPDCPECPQPVVEEVPYQEAWANSPHNDTEAEAFNHWNEDDPAEVPPSCAKCHSTPGYLDFLGEDGTEFGTVDSPAPIGTTIQCVACHNAVAANLSSVVFPSGVEVSGLGPSARCMECHQGRASTPDVLAAIDELGITDEDTPNSELGFINIHYFAAAATLFGSEVHGGFEFEGRAYDGKFMHVEDYDTCAECHNQHTLEVRVESCAGCHEGVTSVEDLHNVRMAGSLEDYDGDGNIEEGIYYEIEGLQEKLLQAIRAYGSEVAGTPIAYDAASYPYFFIDTNDNGEVDGEEGSVPNAYNAWTGRLLKAAYNYQTSIKDPGQFAHNAKYIIELLYDSTDVLNQKLSEPVDLSTAHRIDAGHFAGTQEAFRHWDEEGEVPGSCSRCHSGDGLPFYLEQGVAIAQETTNGLKCSTCHSDLSTFARYEVNEVTFPSGAVLGFDNNVDANLCIECHQGRESTVSVNAAIARAGVGPNEVSEDLNFRNPHYFAAGATLFGVEAEGAYQYEGQEYDGRFTHVEAFDTCVECHNVHQLTVNTDKCSTCHGIEDVEKLRNPGGDTTDYDGDGNFTEGIAGEVETMADTLYEAIRAYAETNPDTQPIAYDPASYPYYFIDANGNGEVDEGETDRYNTWTPELLRAAYNYQWVNKDPGAFAHNGKYIMQVLYDSINAVGGNTSSMTRPPVIAGE